MSDDRVAHLEQLIVDIADALRPPVGSETVRTKGSDLPRLVRELRVGRDEALAMWEGEADLANQYTRKLEAAETERDHLKAVLANELALKDAVYAELTESEARLDEARRDHAVERDQLRAVAVAAQMLLVAIDSTTPGQLFAGIEGRDETAILREKLAAVLPRPGGGT